MKLCQLICYSINFRFFVFIAIATTVTYVTYLVYNESPVYTHQLSTSSIDSLLQVQLRDGNEDKNYLINTEGCQIQKMHPFDPSVSILFHQETTPYSGCYKENYLIVDGDKVHLNSKIVNKKFRNQKLDCTYQPIIRDPYNSDSKADYDVALGSTERLEFGTALKHEFIRVECFIEKRLKFFDYLALVLIKPEVEKKSEELNKKFLGPDPLNIIIMAVDSTSKLNFLRHFPITNGYLQTTLKPFEFHGHTKVADNTFVNMVPMLTGHFVSYYRKGKAVSNSYYDDLDLVWKEFSSMGYRTFFIEDTPDAGTFSYLKRGFKKPATDYYLRPFAVTVEKTNKKWRTKNGAYCLGHTSETEFYYDYFRQFVKTMGKRPFFSFTFISRSTHTYLNSAGYVDRPTFDVIKDLHESNVLNNSVLIFFSDHGIRFGDILETYIGKIEERMPFMFQYYPEWFLKKHEDFREALTINQRRLTTPFDVHKTLQHLVVLSSKDGLVDFREKNPGYGQSFFQEISPQRTCSDANIIPHWCTCGNRINLKNDDKNAISAAKQMMITINEWTNSTNNFSLCVVQTVKEIIDVYVWNAERTLSRSDESIVDILNFLVTVRANPSNAEFEGTVELNKGTFRVLGDISRINSYGNQSWCTENQTLKKFCFCNHFSS